MNVPDLDSNIFDNESLVAPYAIGTPPIFEEIFNPLDFLSDEFRTAKPAYVYNASEIAPAMPMDSVPMDDCNVLAQLEALSVPSSASSPEGLFALLYNMNVY
jgi:hypothetical protein